MRVSPRLTSSSDRPRARARSMSWRTSLRGRPASSLRFATLLPRSGRRGRPRDVGAGAGVHPQDIPLVDEEGDGHHGARFKRGGLGAARGRIAAGTPPPLPPPPNPPSSPPPP